jgi:hypothetical protein
VLIREPLDQLEKQEAMELLATSYHVKGDLDSLLPNIKKEHYIEVLQLIWDFAIKKSHSFMVKTKKDDLLGVAINFDVEERPDIVTTNPLEAIIAFLESIEKPVM